METLGQESISNADKSDYPWRFIAFIIAIFIYAIAGSPTPDTLGIPEVIIGFILIISAFPVILDIFHVSKVHNIIILTGLIIPTMIGVYNEHSTITIMRDSIAFLFLALPFLISPVIKTPRQRNLFFYALVMLGIAFSIRGILVSFALYGDSLTYFSNAPTVILSCLVLIGYASNCFERKFSLKPFAIIIVVISLATIPFIAMHLTLQRASVACVGVGTIIFWLHMMKKSPLKTLALTGLIATMMYPLWMDIAFIADAYIAKTRIHGVNMRLEEWSAVFNQISPSPLNILFGKGWGAAFPSPAVADITVSYTHSLLSAMILKTGLIGSFITAAFCCYIYKTLYEIRSITPIYLTLPLFFAFSIPVFLYASYKSLDFGFIILAILVCKNIPFVESERATL